MKKITNGLLVIAVLFVLCGNAFAGGRGHGPGGRGPGRGGFRPAPVVHHHGGGHHHGGDDGHHVRLNGPGLLPVRWLLQERQE